jgi:YegS/Rv2252/BmrU family lipid kinase
MSFNIIILSNSGAGKRKPAVIVGFLVSGLRELKVPHLVYDIDWPAELHTFSHIFLVGGDGTLNYFINQYPDCRIPISLFKGGTGNDFAWKLYGDKSYQDYFQDAIYKTPREVDAGICNGKYFLNGVGVGFDGEVVQTMLRSRKYFGGQAAYLWAVMKKIFSYREKTIRISFGNNSRAAAVNIFMITIANGSRFGGGFLVAPQAHVSDRQLDLVIIEKVSVLKRLYYLPAIEKGKHLGLPFVKSYKLSKISIEANQTLAAHCDGELITASKFEIQILPARFRFRY